MSVRTQTRSNLSSPKLLLTACLGRISCYGVIIANVISTATRLEPFMPPALLQGGGRKPPFSKIPQTPGLDSSKKMVLFYM